MTATLVNATLSYRVSITNTGPAAISDIAISGDMLSAHTSVPQAELLGESDTPLPLLHQLLRLLPGESEVLTDEIRLPLAAIIPIHRGNARLFVPIARIAATGKTDNGSTICLRTAYLVGQAQDTAARLQPFRLDLGPRVYAGVSQRPVTASSG